MYITILGRQPHLSVAELESCFGSENTRWFSSESALVDTSEIIVSHLGGILKAGQVTLDLKQSDWQQTTRRIVENYSTKWATSSGKITLGIGVYGFSVSSRDVQRIGILIKNNLKKNGVSLRLIPNSDKALNTATSHHNKLGLSANKVELLIIRSESGMVMVAESTGAQNITALARRDQARPKRDAFVGMLPPKLALTMLNLATGGQADTTLVLDPFCGTGVVLQEALLRGYDVYGSDLNQKMVHYTQENLSWLQKTHRTSGTVVAIEEGDATTHTWPGLRDTTAVVSETYLGQPFSAPPSEKKLDEVRRNVDHITSTFLKNIHAQLPKGTRLCLAVPAWRSANGSITHLPLIRSLPAKGFDQVQFKNVTPSDLIYYREDQVVARELLVLVTA